MRVLAPLLFTLCAPLLASAAEPTALELFQRRIVPILQAQNASSCADCHLSGVDLKQYIRPSQEQTFAALRAAGLVNTEAPGKSKLLEFISRQPKQPSPVSQRARQEEFAAFSAWITAAAKDPTLASVRATEKIGPQLPPEVVRHAREDHVLALFVENVWSEVGRCAACHSPDRNQEQVRKHGAQVSWIQLRDPEATLAHLVEYELLDLDRPEKSKLLTKPTNQVQHGGGIKLTVGDRTYTRFRQFIADYAAVKRGQYQRAAELPVPSAEVSQVADLWLKVENVPARFDKKVLRVNVYRWNDAAGTWSGERWATADRQVAGERRLWQQHLTLTAARSSERGGVLARGEVSLPPGKYLVRIYVDENENLAKKFPYELGEQEFVGEVEVNSRWPAGYAAMTVVKYPAK